jgi:hypothetical protein
MLLEKLSHFEHLFIMNSKKRKTRIRQTKNEFQKAFEPYPEMIQMFSWSERSPEFIHISISLIENDFELVKAEFNRICNLISEKYCGENEFIFTLSETIKLIKQKDDLLDELTNSLFGNAFKEIIPFYADCFKIEFKFEVKPQPQLLLTGFLQILDGRSTISILSKYLFLQYQQRNGPDFLGLNSLTESEIIQPKNISRIMSMFPLLGQSEKFDIEFSKEIWKYNYSYSPLICKPDDTMSEEKQYEEMKIDNFRDEFEGLYTEFKKLNLTAIYPDIIAQVNMGFIARICNLSIDTINFIKTHKGEIAELVYRTNLESFIVGTWLIKRQDPSLYERFFDYSTGRQKFFGEQIIKKTENELVKREIEKFISKTIQESGLNPIEVASERGDIFDLKIDQMANELWGESNEYYFQYKRFSEVTHGHWKVISKYHLEKSYNPMHNGILWYNENPNHFAGLLPAFKSLLISVEFLVTVLNDINATQTEELKNKLLNLRERIVEQWTVYFKKYVVPDVDFSEGIEN